MSTRTSARLESSTIRPIPLSERHGTAADLFTVWFGTNFMLLTVVTGGLAVTAFGLSFGWALLALTAGNLIGAIFMALHSAQGPTLGVPQMIQTRGQFGTLGSLLVVCIVLVMYVGFLASNLVIGGEAPVSIASGAIAVLALRTHRRRRMLCSWNPRAASFHQHAALQRSHRARDGRRGPVMDRRPGHYGTRLLLACKTLDIHS
jgi:cytosine/uracil/thiamine/allantoin permease